MDKRVHTSTVEPPSGPAQKKARKMVKFTKNGIDLYPTKDNRSCPCDITFFPSTGIVTLNFQSHEDLEHIRAHRRQLRNQLD